jgi:ketose-bisphosphate aldolase
MPLVNFKSMLAAAREGRYAVAAFNPVDYASMRAAVEAAEAERAPVILQTSAKTVKYHGHEAIASWARRLGDAATVPVALHLDHGKDLDLIRRCIETGWTAVMIDASDKPFEENLALTRQVLDLAAPKNVGVEAEIGEIGGVEEDIAVADEAARLCDPDKAEACCQALPELAVFAPACGTAHGYYHGEPKVAFDLLADISRRTRRPLALHGGTGLPAETVRRCIANGCAKVNISTNLKHVFIDGFCDYHRDHPHDYEPLNLLRAQHQAMVAMLREKIRLCGGGGKG